MRRGGRGFRLARAAAAQSLHQHEEHGNDEDAEERRAELQAELEAVRKQLATATAKNRSELQNRAAVLQSELDLVKARVNLGGISPEGVEVQLFHGLVDSFGEIPQPRTVIMAPASRPEGSTWTFTGNIPCQSSGQHGYRVRVLPRHADLANSFEPGLVCWG